MNKIMTGIVCLYLFVGTLITNNINGVKCVCIGLILWILYKGVRKQ